MTRKLPLLIILLFSASCFFPMPSKASKNDLRKQNQKPTLLERYTDSLALARKIYIESADSVIPEPSQGMTPNLSRLFPLTFYHGVSGRLFGAREKQSMDMDFDRIMGEMYILHPEWVIDTESNLIADGDIAYRPEAPVKNDVGMTSQAEQESITLPSSSQPSGEITLVATKPNFWSFSGDYSLQFLQNYVSDNWYKGGESTYSMIGAFAFNANYNDKEKIKWDNRLEMKLGMQSSQGDSEHKFKSSEDLIRLTSKLGVQSVNHWYYTLQAIASTQFTHGYKSNDATVYSDFMSPLNVNLSLGMDYKVNWLKGKLAGTVNISPLAANFKYVDRLALSSKYGIDEGKHALWDIGSTFTTDLQWKFSDLIRWQTRLYAYTTYKRTEVEWENTVTFQLSKYISTKVFVYPRFDDSAKEKDSKYGYFQLKEYWSLGFNYNF